MFISNTIYRGERSLKRTSTASRLIFVLLHHLSTPPSPSPSSSSTTHVKSPTSPSPLLKDVGSTSTASAPSEARMQPQSPLPFPKGCGRLSLSRRRIRGRREMREAHEVGCPGGKSQNTSHDICRGSFSLSVFISPLLTPLTLPPGRSDTPNQRR